MEPVELSDDVVVLSAPTVADVDRITELCQDPDVQRWTTVPSPYARADAEGFVGWAAAGWAEGRDATWGVRAGGRLEGMAGLSIQPAGSAEVGYWLGPGARGQGLMHRSVRLLVDHAFDPAGLDLQRVEWRCYAGNWPSWRVAWRVGFRLEGVLRAGAVQRDTRRDEWVGSLLRDDPRSPAEPWQGTLARWGQRPPE